MKRNLFVAFIATCIMATTFCLPANARQERQKATPSDSTSNKLFCVPYIIQPEFPGGYKALMLYIHDHLRWPKKVSCTKDKIRVVIGCTIDKKGRVRKVKVMRSFAPEYDKEAIRVVKKLPKFEPARMNGKVVNIRYVIHVVFKKSNQ